MRSPMLLALLAALGGAGCVPQTIVDGTADLTFQLTSPAQVVHDERPAIVAVERDEGGGTYLTFVDDAGSVPCDVVASAANQEVDITGACTFATSIGNLAVQLTKARLSWEAEKPITIEGVLVDRSGTMKLTFSGTPR
jgi:hypothetical protein